MSIYQNENDRIHNLSFSDSSHLYVIKLVKNYIKNVFYNSIPSSLTILRNHLKNCLYSKELKSIEYWYKEVDKDIERLKLIK